MKKGYKLTEVGVIPEDWEVKKLSEIADIKTGPFGSSLHEKDYVEDGTPIITVEHLGEQGIAHQNVPMVSDFDRQRLLSYSLKTDDIVFSRVGSVDRNSLVSEKEDGWLFSGRLLRIGINYAFISPVYLSYHLHQEPSKQRIRNAAVGQTMASLNTEILKNILVALPPTKAEQTAIANALSDADAMIQSIEKLIAKKRNIKQGAMQELLSGKKRLPGFQVKPGYKQTEVGGIPEDWEVKRLGELFEITSSKRVFQGEWKTEGIPFYRARELAVLGEKGFIKNELFISKEMYDVFKNVYGVPQIGDMLVTGVGTLGKVYLVSDDHKFYFKDGNIIWFKISRKVRPDFLRQLYLTRLIIKQIDDASAGTTVGTYTISGAKKTTIPFPSLAEQEAIATILSDMDAEISALEAKLMKYKQIKKGMMQNLLTGKMRLIDTSKKKHNWQINEAVVIAVLTKEFGSEKFPLGRKRCTKLSYLLHRHVERAAEGYFKKAAGPYNPSTKYGGPEDIAQKNKYIKQSASGQYSGFVAAENIAKAEEYFDKWYGQDALKWLSQFKYEKNDTLELWATVDMAVQDLKRNGKEVSTEAVKGLISNTEEWKPKLKRAVFSDENIAMAILKTDELFNS